MHKRRQLVETTTFQKVARIILGIFMVTAALGHLTCQRNEFQAQVPSWIPLDKDLIVILSGIVELLFGITLLFWRKQRINVGLALAIFFILIFPGNVSQYLNHRDAFGLNTDSARLIRLFFQPILILWALWSTGALSYLTQRHQS